jgi:hypothetical protein
MSPPRDGGPLIVEIVKFACDEPAEPLPPAPVQADVANGQKDPEAVNVWLA